MTPTGHSLDAIVRGADRIPRVRRDDAREGDWLFVRTRNSLYTIQLGTGGGCRVWGGWFDRRGKSPMQTTVAGCTWGGSVIKVDLLAAIGLRIEFGNRLTTTEAVRITLFHREALN